jgi:hypothetical protein
MIVVYSRAYCLRTTPFTTRHQCFVSLGSFLTGHEARFLFHQSIMDHHSLAFQLFLFLMFYGTFEWIRHELNVTQRQQEQVSDSTHTVEVVNETIGQTDDSIVSTSSTSTNIQVHLETEPKPEPALHTSELVSIVQLAEEPIAIAELTNIELSAIAPVEPVLTETPIPTLPTSATAPAIPSVALGSSHDALFPASVSTITESPLSTQSECPINTLFTFPLDVISEASSIEPMTAAVAEAVEIVPNLQPTGSLPKTSSQKKRQPRQTKKIKAVA